MADRSFTLIGNFTDNISPSIKKVNVSLGGLKRNLEAISRLTSPLKNDFKDLASHSKDFANSLKGQKAELKSASAELKRYKSELQQIAALQRSLGPLNMGGGRGNRGGGGWGYGGGGGARGPVARDASFTFGQILGNQVAGVMTNAIVQGFQMGVGLMQKPFQYFASALGERIQDEQSDIKAAGGVYSIAMRQNKPFVKTFAEAMKFTQENNKYMAELAGALPGNTQQYIEVFKRLSDSISRTVMSNTTETIKLANELRADPNRTGGTAPAITDMGSKGIKQAITEIGGEITKKTVLAGLGGGSAGGVAGAYGLPQLTERLLTQQEVTMGQFRRYAAIFRDPMISDALERYIPKINATVATSADRTRILLKMFDEILPPEVVRAFQRSTSGIIEQFKTMLIGPEVGFLGLGRKMGGLGKAMNDFGEYVDKNGKVVKTAAEAEPIDLSIFDLLRDIFANFGLSLAPIVEFLPTLFDPLRKIGESLSDLRTYSGIFFSNFTYYKNSLIKFSEKLKLTDKAGAEKIAKNLSLRAILLNINNAFRGAGIYGYGEEGKQTFAANAKKIVAPDFDPAPMLKSFIETFMNSDAAYALGKKLGTVISVVLQQVSGILNQIVGVASAGKLVSGFKDGFGEEGKEAVSNIIRKVFQGIAKALYTVFQAAPLEFTIAGIATLGLPALMGALSTQLGAVIEGWIDGTGSGLGTRIRELGKKGAARFGNMGENLRALPGKARALPGKLNPLGGGGSALGSLATNFISTISRVSKYFTEFGNRFKGFFSGFLGKFAIFGAIVSTIGALLSGKDLAAALASGAGPLLGAALGAALIPFLGPLGPILGSFIGSQIGGSDAVTGPLTEVFNALLGAMQGLFDVVMVVVGAVWDLVASLFELVGRVFGVNGQFDGLKIILAPFTLAFQALELGLKGFAVLLQQVRVWLTNWLGSAEEKKAAQAELDRLNAQLKTSQGRANAYNASMLGVGEMRKKRAEAWGELNSGKVNQARSAELRTFVEELDKHIAKKLQPPAAATGPRGAATPAQKPLQNLAISATNATKGIDKTIKGMPSAASTGVAKALSNMSTVEASAALAKKISEMPTSASRVPSPNAGRRVGYITINGILYWQGTDGNLTKVAAKAFGSSNPFTGSLGKAINFEMANKPSGSSLVIANSSETIIPAAGGLGMSDLMGTLNTGFYTLSREMRFGGGAAINAPISIYQQPGQDPEELAAIVVARLSMAVESLSNYV